MRAVTISAGRATTDPIRFALNELLRPHRVRRYTLRRSGRNLFLRHPVADAWVVHEVFDLGVYEPPPQVERVIMRAPRPRIVDLGAHIGVTATGYAHVRLRLQRDAIDTLSTALHGPAITKAVGADDEEPPSRATHVH